MALPCKGLQGIHLNPVGFPSKRGSVTSRDGLGTSFSAMIVSRPLSQLSMEAMTCGLTRTMDISVNSHGPYTAPCHGIWFLKSNKLKKDSTSAFTS